MKKVLFSDKCRLTQAVLDGDKTRFFYILSGKDLKKLDAFKEEYYTLTMDTLEGVDLANAYLVNYPERLPFGIKEVVAVAQSYKDAGYTCIPYHDTDEYMYLKRNGVILKDISVPSCAVRNKLFVKAELMPRGVQIVGIDLRRIHDIDEEDYTKEGLIYMPELAVRYPYGCLNRYGAFTKDKRESPRLQSWDESASMQLRIYFGGASPNCGAGVRPYRIRRPALAHKNPTRFSCGSMSTV